MPTLFISYFLSDPSTFSTVENSYDATNDKHDLFVSWSLVKENWIYVFEKLNEYRCISKKNPVSPALSRRYCSEFKWAKKNNNLRLLFEGK